MIRVLGATGFELAGVRRARRRPDVALLRSGMGREAAEQALTSLAAGADDRVLAVGFAGALRDDAPPGSAWLVNETLIPGDETPCPLSEGRLAWARRRLEDLGVGVRSLLTTPRFVRDPAEKRRLGLASGAALVDLEGYWIARAARRLGVPLVMLKVVSDGVDQRLPSVLAGRPASLLRLPETLSLARLGLTAWGARRVLGRLTDVLVAAYAEEGP